MADDLFDYLEGQFGPKEPEQYVGDLIDKMNELLALIQPPPETAPLIRQAVWRGTMSKYSDALIRLSQEVRSKVHPDQYEGIF